jgi:hypothetical protein
MTDSVLRYDLLVEDALRGVVRAALEQVAEHGLPGEHHFYITFRTTHPGVEIADRLRERYPGEMTIVLQHRYWDLEVTDERFGVTLSFNDIPERLSIPYDAVSAFADPSVRFGLQFDAGESEDEDDDIESEDDDEALPEGEAMAQDEDALDKAAADSATEKVVTLDNFRRKT